MSNITVGSLLLHIKKLLEEERISLEDSVVIYNDQGDADFVQYIEPCMAALSLKGTYVAQISYGDYPRLDHRYIWISAIEIS